MSTYDDCSLEALGLLFRVTDMENLDDASRRQVILKGAATFVVVYRVLTAVT